MAEPEEEIKDNETNGRNSIPSLTTKENMMMSKDLKYFKNELLKEMKKIKVELFSKITQYSLELNEKIKKTSSENEQLDEKIEFISKKIDAKITSFLNEKNKYNLDRIFTDIRDNIMTNDVKIQAIRDELKVHKDQYEEIVKDNILYQGMIGPGCKYRNMHQFIDFLLASLNNISTQINQKTSDMKSYKTKTDNTFHNINSQINGIILGYKSYVNQSMKDFDSKIRNEIKLFDDKLLELRVQNMQSIKNFQTKLHVYDEKYKIMDNLENTINNNNKKVIDDIKETSAKLYKMIDDYKKQFEEMKKEHNELFENDNDIKKQLNDLNLFYKKNMFDDRDDQKISPKYEQNITNNDLLSGQEFDIKNKRVKNQSTETFVENYNSTEKKLNKNNLIENSPPKNLISKIYLRMNRGKKGRKGSQKILKNERLEKFNFLYNDNNLNEYYLFNRSLDNVRSIKLENNPLNKTHTRINSSMARMRSKKTKRKNRVENYTSRDLYDTGLLVNFNSKNEEDNYINNLKNNALCVKLLEKGIKLDYLNEYINKSSNFHGEYFYSSKNFQKENHINSKHFGKDKNYFNVSFIKKVNSNLEENKYHEYLQKGENDGIFIINDNGYIYRNPQNKMKIKNLSAIG